MNLTIVTAAEELSAVTEEMNNNIFHISDMTEFATCESIKISNDVVRTDSLVEDINKPVNQFKV